MKIPTALALAMLIAFVAVAGICAHVEKTIKTPPRNVAALEIVDVHRALAPGPVITTVVSDIAVKPVQYRHKASASRRVELDIVLYQAHVEWVDSQSICPASDNADFKLDAKKHWRHVAMY